MLRGSPKMLIASFSEKESKYLLISMILTDGSAYFIGNRPRLAYYGNDKILHSIFESLLLKIYGLKPTYSNKDRTVYSIKRVIKVYNDLIKITKVLSKNDDSIDISSLLNSSKKCQNFMTRLIMSAEGSITITRNDKGSIRGNLGFACANLKLCEQWRKLFNLNNIRMAVRADKAVYTGIHGLEVINHESIRNFAAMGGFVDSVKVQRGRFKGHNKNDVLQALTKFYDKIASEEYKNYTKWPNEKFYKKFRSFIVRGGKRRGYQCPNAKPGLRCKVEDLVG